MNYKDLLSKFSFLAIILLTSSVGYGQEILTITVPSYANDTCELFYLGRHEFVILDENGRGEIELDELKTFCYGTIKDKIRFNVYTGGESLQVNIDDKCKPTFSGTHSKACEHLNQVQYPYFISIGIHSFSEFMTKMNTHRSDQLRVLKNAKVGDRQFEKHQRIKFKYSNAQLLLQYFISNSIEITDDYKDFFDKLSVEDEAMTFSSEYTFFLYAYSSSKLNRQNKDMLIFNNQRIEAIADDIVSHYKDRRIVEAVLHHIAVNEVDRYGNSSRFDSIYRKNVVSETLLKEYDIIYAKWENTMVGMLFPTLDLTDIDNNYFDLSKYKGKYVVIDMWATWCSPCIREQKIMTDIEGEYKDKEVLFITISCDKKRLIWENYVRKNLHGGTHFNTINSGFNDTYGITTIPRFMLLDRDGRIVSANFFKPSNSNFRRALDFLLK